MMPIDVYAARHKNKNIVNVSRSGGFFTAVSDYVLQNGGVVYGCIQEEKDVPRHIRATTTCERDTMRGSKYAQSKMGNILNDIKKDVESGLLVLFTGTPCQVAGVKNYIGFSHVNIIYLDIVCHGVPSPKVIQEYFKWLVESKGEISSFEYRNKIEYGWHDHVETTYFKNGKRFDSRVYTNMFYSHMALRPCCYECRYKNMDRMGDFSIADFWGIERLNLDLFNDDKGISLVLVNTINGKNIIDKLSNYIELVKVSAEDYLQPPLIGNFEQPLNRNDFWNDFNNKGFAYIAQIYGKGNEDSQFKYFIKRLIYRMKNIIRNTK